MNKVDDETVNRCTILAAKHLVNRKIIGVRYMTKSEADECGWYSRPVVMQLDNGVMIFPAADDEGNNGGALWTTNAEAPIIGVI